jgi:hypothetical protein
MNQIWLAKIIFTSGILEGIEIEHYFSFDPEIRQYKNCIGGSDYKILSSRKQS